LEIFICASGQASGKMHDIWFFDRKALFAVFEQLFLTNDYCGRLVDDP
jgi:hypothetical protein